MLAKVRDLYHPNSTVSQTHIRDTLIYVTHSCFIARANSGDIPSFPVGTRADLLPKIGQRSAPAIGKGEEEDLPLFDLFSMDL